MKKDKKKKKSRKGLPLWIKVTIGMVVMGGIIASIVSLDLVRKVYMPNVEIKNTDKNYLFIPTGSSYEDVKKIIVSSGIIKDPGSFDWVAKKMNYRNHIHPGKYRLKAGMSNKALILMLRGGNQEPVMLRIKPFRNASSLAGYIARNLEADSVTLAAILSDKPFLREHNLTRENVLGAFIPNTHEFYWNTNSREFFDRMIVEFAAFWTEQRRSKAQAAGLTPMEVITLASIVVQETNLKDEMPVIAGVYLNRLRKGWKLQADPTLVFIMENLEDERVMEFRKRYERNPGRRVKRVLKAHKEFDSPYNTYLYFGLPPGPITMPEISAIDAVLNSTVHNYMFFCARPDLTGHDFAVTYEDHQLNAKRYQAAISRRGDGADETNE